MKIDVDSQGLVELSKVFGSLTIKTEDGHKFGIAQRDTGLEIVVQDVHIGIFICEDGSVQIQKQGRVVDGTLLDKKCKSLQDLVDALIREHQRDECAKEHSHSSSQVSPDTIQKLKNIRRGLRETFRTCLLTDPATRGAAYDFCLVAGQELDKIIAELSNTPPKTTQRKEERGQRVYNVHEAMLELKKAWQTKNAHDFTPRMDNAINSLVSRIIDLCNGDTQP